MNTEIIIHTEQLDDVVIKSGLDKEDGLAVKQNYSPFFEQLQVIKEQSAKINYESPTDVDEKIARDLRLKTVKIRTGAADVKDARKKIHLLKGNLEQAAFNLIKADCELIEEGFTQVEKAREIAEKKRKAELKTQRLELLQPYESVISTQFIDLENMGDDDFTKMLDSAKLTLQAKIDAEKKAEEERLAAIEAEKKRQEEIRLENERLKKEAEEKEKALAIERAKAETERKKQEAIRQAEQKRADELLEAQRKKAETERKAAEAKAAKERAEAEAKLKAEQERARKEMEEAHKIAAEKLAKEAAERAKIEAELKAKQDAELAEKKRIEAEAKAKADAEAKLAKAGDKKRLQAWIGNIEVPGINPEGMKPESIKVLDDIQSKHAAFIKWAMDQINAL